MATRFISQALKHNGRRLYAFCRSQNRSFRLERRLAWEGRLQAIPTHAFVLCVIYPILGLVLFRMVVGYSVLPLLFPLAAGLYVDWSFCRARTLRTQPRRERRRGGRGGTLCRGGARRLSAHSRVGTLLFVLFGIWIRHPRTLSNSNLRPRPADASLLSQDASDDAEGWSLIIVGCGVCFLFAVVALCVSVVSFR